jgi:hypothetical protein
MSMCFSLEVFTFAGWTSVKVELHSLEDCLSSTFAPAVGVVTPP